MPSGRPTRSSRWSRAASSMADRSGRHPPGDNTVSSSIHPRVSGASGRLIAGSFSASSSISAPDPIKSDVRKLNVTPPVGYSPAARAAGRRVMGQVVGFVLGSSTICIVAAVIGVTHGGSWVALVAALGIVVSSSMAARTGQRCRALRVDATSSWWRRRGIWLMVLSAVPAWVSIGCAAVVLHTHAP